MLTFQRYVDDVRPTASIELSLGRRRKKKPNYLEGLEEELWYAKTFSSTSRHKKGLAGKPFPVLDRSVSSVVSLRLEEVTGRTVTNLLLLLLLLLLLSNCYLFPVMGCASSSMDAEVHAADSADPHNRHLTRLPAPWKWPGELTANDLANRRSAFWDTAGATGRNVVWQTLHITCDALLLGDVELASSIIVAGGLTVPRGDLSSAGSLLAYDHLGAAYEVPRFLFSTPANVLSPAEAAARAAARRPLHDPQRPCVPLDVTVRLAATGVTQEQDVKLSLGSTSSVADLAAALDAALASGSYDLPIEETVKKPNVWMGKGLPADRQRLMFR